jgi:hypothetical protein
VHACTTTCRFLLPIAFCNGPQHYPFAPNTATTTTQRRRTRATARAGGQRQRLMRAGPTWRMAGKACARIAVPTAHVSADMRTSTRSCGDSAGRKGVCSRGRPSTRTHLPLARQQRCTDSNVSRPREIRTHSHHASVPRRYRSVAVHRSAPPTAHFRRRQTNAERNAYFNESRCMSPSTYRRLCEWSQGKHEVEES